MSGNFRECIGTTYRCSHNNLILLRSQIWHQSLQ